MKKQLFSVRLPVDLLKELKESAEVYGLSFTTYVSAAVNHANNTDHEGFKEMVLKYRDYEMEYEDEKSDS